MTRSEKAATRRAIRQSRREIKRTSAVDEARDFGRGLGRVVSGYDFGVVVLVIALSLFGVAMVFSAGYYQTINTAHPDPTYYLFRQMLWVGTGLFVMLIVANIDYHIYMKVSYLIVLVSVVLLVLVILTSSTVGGAVAGYMYIMAAKTPAHWYQRITSFRDPFADFQGSG